jgi:hypothetical protein
MQTSGFVDQLLDIHRDGNAFRDAARARAGLCRLGDPRRLAQARMDFGKTSLGGFVGDGPVRTASFFARRMTLAG